VQPAMITAVNTINRLSCVVRLLNKCTTLYKKN